MTTALWIIAVAMVPVGLQQGKTFFVPIYRRVRFRVRQGYWF